MFKDLHWLLLRNLRVKLKKITTGNYVPSVHSSSSRNLTCHILRSLPGPTGLTASRRRLERSVGSGLQMFRGSWPHNSFPLLVKTWPAVSAWRVRAIDCLGLRKLSCVGWGRKACDWTLGGTAGDSIGTFVVRLRCHPWLPLPTGRGRGCSMGPAVSTVRALAVEASTGAWDVTGWLPVRCVALAPTRTRSPTFRLERFLEGRSKSRTLLACTRLAAPRKQIWQPRWSSPQTEPRKFYKTHRSPPTG